MNNGCGLRVYCHDCKLYHESLNHNDCFHFIEKHNGHRVGFNPETTQYRPNANRKLAYGAEVSMTVTSLHSKASSATAGWSSAYVDNTSDLYIDALIQVTLDPANTAAANYKSFLIFVFGGTNSSDLGTTGAATGGVPGTQGDLTFPNIDSNAVNLPLAYAMPYVTADVVLKSPPLSIAKCLGSLVLPPFWGVAILNYSGAALAASGNAVKYRPVYETII